MFERFTDRAQQVVVLAQEEARLLNHNYVGTEHILLGLVHDGDGVAAKALASLSISLEAVRAQVVEVVGQGETPPPEGHIPFTPRAKKVFELSLREALQLGHDYIGTEHLLLGLVREGQGVAAQVLVSMGANLKPLRDQVVRLLKGNSGPEAPTGDFDSATWPSALGEERWLTAQRTMSGRSREVLERALGEALAAPAPEIEPEHLLLALLGDVDLLRRAGFDPQEIRRRLVERGGDSTSA